jgi:hypothetical protein
MPGVERSLSREDPFFSLGEILSTLEEILLSLEEILLSLEEVLLPGIERSLPRRGLSPVARGESLGPP